MTIKTIKRRVDVRGNIGQFQQTQDQYSPHSK
jgi:hypothetical protein